MCWQWQGEPPNPDKEPTLPKPQMYMRIKAIDRASMYGCLVCKLHKSPWLRGNWGGILKYSLLSAVQTIGLVSTTPTGRKEHLFLSHKDAAQVLSIVPSQRGSFF